MERIMIIHDELQVGEYRLLANFFRLVGILVYNCAIAEDTTFSTEEGFDAVLIITLASRSQNNEVLEQKIKAVKEVYEGNVPIVEISRFEFDLMLIDEKQKNERIHYIVDCVEKIQQKANVPLKEADVEALKKIADIYVNYDLMKYGVALAFFVNYDAIVQVVQKYYVNAYVEVASNTAEGSENAHLLESVYYCYFISNIARYVNETCDFLKQRLIFDSRKIQSLLERKIQELEKDPHKHKHKGMVSSIYMLIGYCLECDSERRKESGKYYQNAIEECGESGKLCCYPHYRLGRFYEKQEHDREKAIAEYQEAYRLNPKEYRAVYKIADYYKEKRNFVEAFNKYYEITTILDNRGKSNVLQPKEYEYLYKAWFFMSELYKVKSTDISYSESQEKVQEKLDEVVRLARDEGKNNLVFECIYGPDGTVDCRDDDQDQGKQDVRELTARRVKEVCPLFRR